MVWRSYMLVPVFFSSCFQILHSVGGFETPAVMRAKMNLSADPCEDFSEFACGRFIREYVLPDDKIDMMSFYAREDENNLIIHDLLVNTTNSTRPRYVKNMQRFFNSCMNQTQIEVLGLTQFLNDRAFVDDWPTLNPRWSEAGFDINEVIPRYLRAYTSPILVVNVVQNKTDGSKHVIELTQPSFGLGKRSFKLNRNHPLIQAYEKQMVETAVALNASRGVAERDAREVVDLEIELSSILVPLEQQQDVTKLISSVKLSQFSTLYPRLDIARAIRSTFSIVNITLPDDEIIINSFPSYMKDVESVLECFPNRTIQNLFGFTYAMSRLNKLTRQMANISAEFEKTAYGISTQASRWTACVDTIKYDFSMGISKMFVSRVFSGSAKLKVHEMIDKIEVEMLIMIKNAMWLSNSTKNQAFKKLVAMKRQVGYPDADFEEADMDRLYENYNMSADNFYNNQVLLNDLYQRAKLASLRKPVDKNKWHHPPHAVNAFAARERNRIELNAGIMQAPFYSETATDYMNYGGIGYVIGHEITHLYDNIGKRYDENGNVRNWWTAEDQANFDNRSKCIQDQFSSFHVDELNMTTNGVNIKSESEADTGGIKLAYRAYKKLVHNRRTYMWLPNLNLTHHQLFFLSMAQLYCQVATIQRKMFYVQATIYPLGRYRIIGTMQNSEDFARAYKCPLGSYMNPVKKCGVW